jgi:hypothetical protein
MFICPSVVFVLIASVFAQSLQQNTGPEFRRLPSPTNFMQSKPGAATNSAPWASDCTKSAGSPCQMNPRPVLGLLGRDTRPGWLPAAFVPQ